MAAQRVVSPLLVLCYHGISHDDEHEWNPELYMPPSLFEQRLRSLVENGFQIRSLGESLQLAEAGALETPTVALTFDDGWHDFYSQAWPILKKFNAPATVYQTTFYSNYNRPVFDVACSYLLWRGRGRWLRQGLLPGMTAAVELDSRATIRAFDATLKERVRTLQFNAEDKDALLGRLAAALDLKYSELLQSRRLHLMNAAEIAEISRNGIDVQLHTHNHSMPRDRDGFLQEIQRNRFFIELTTGKPAVHFCYPNGWHRPELGEWLADAGVRSATTCDPGFVRRSSDVMYLPRLTDSCRVSQVRFESWLAGVGLWGSTFKRLFTVNGNSPSRSAAAIRAFQAPGAIEIPTTATAEPEHAAARAAGTTH